MFELLTGRWLHNNIFVYTLLQYIYYFVFLGSGNTSNIVCCRKTKGHIGHASDFTSALFHIVSPLFSELQQTILWDGMVLKQLISSKLCRIIFWWVKYERIENNVLYLPLLLWVQPSLIPLPVAYRIVIGYITPVFMFPASPPPSPPSPGSLLYTGLYYVIFIPVVMFSARPSPAQTPWRPTTTYSKGLTSSTSPEKSRKMLRI